MPKVTITGAKTMDNTTTRLPMNVLDAARWRINNILDTYDTVAVAFSGGKDSLVTMHLLREALEARAKGKPVKVNVVFRDEEVIQNHVIDFVDFYRRQPWVKMLWFTVPLKSQKFILGRAYAYLQWDPAREWVRTKPEWGINRPDGEVYDQYSMDDLVATYYKGKVCVLTGIRCQESLMRFRAVVNKVGQPWVAGTKCKRLDLGRPIYDWTENDIFKYLHESGIRYAEIYDRQSAAGFALRVSTPLHAESAKRLDYLREQDPEFYDSVLRVFPEMAVQGKYFNDLQKITDDEVPETPAELKNWLMISYEGAQLKLALQRFDECMAFWRNPKVAPMYPMRYVYGQFKSGAFKRVFLPKAPK